MGHVPAGPLPEERAGAHLPRRQRRRGRASRVQAARARRDLGRLGERLAAAHLRRSGCRVLAANLRSGRGEIDLLVMDAGIRVAVEVKTRIGADPIVEITPEKRRRLAAAVAALHPRPRRIDAILIRLDRDGATIRRLRGVV